MSMTDMAVARGGVHQHSTTPLCSSTGGRYSGSMVFVVTKDHRGYMTREDVAKMDRLMGVDRESMPAPRTHPDILPEPKRRAQKRPPAKGLKPGAVAGVSIKTIDCFERELRKCDLPDKPLPLERIKIYKAKSAGYWGIRVSVCNVTHYYPGPHLECNVLKAQKQCLNRVNSIIKERKK